MRKKLSYLLFSIAIIAFIYPVIYWHNNPDLSEMKMISKFWYAYASTIICFVGGYVLKVEIK